MPSILFVCTGNIHRSLISSMAFNKKLINSKFSNAGIEISSAGTWAKDGLKTGRRTTVFAERYQLDIRGHRARLINADIISNADLILVMEQGQLEALSHEFPQFKVRIYMLTAVDGQPGYDILDPIRVDGDEHTQILEEILEIVDQKFESICTLAIQLAGL